MSIVLRFLVALTLLLNKLYAWDGCDQFNQWRWEKHLQNGSDRKSTAKKCEYVANPKGNFIHLQIVCNIQVRRHMYRARRVVSMRR